MLHRQQAGRQVLGVGIDRVAEQEQLHDRQRDDEAQRHRVAPHLDPFLAQQRHEPPEGECRHDPLPFTLSMWMNTSSRRGSTSCQERTAPPASPDGAFERGAVGPGDVQGASEHGGRLDAGHAPQPPRRRVHIAARRLESDEARMSGDLVRRALHDDAPVGEIDDALAALGLVHVVGRDEHGQAVAGHVVDQVPELAARLGVDAGRRLVEQQQLSARAGRRRRARAAASSRPRAGRPAGRGDRRAPCGP